MATERTADPRAVYPPGAAPKDWIQTIKQSENRPPSLEKPAYGFDSPLGCLASNIMAPLYIYASYKGKHDLWDYLLSELPDSTFEGPSLDMGCGRGMVLLKVAQRKKARSIPTRAYAVDIFSTGDQTGNAPEATYANAASLDVLENVVLHTASFTEELPFADGVFSLVTSSLAIHNVNSDGRRKAIEQLARVCRPGGQVLVLDLMGSVKTYQDTLLSLGWKDVSYEFGGVGVMFGAWPCQVLKATKPR